MENRILFVLAGTQRQASTRYRAIQFIPYLKKNGFSTELHFPAEKQKSGIKRIITTIREEYDILRKSKSSHIIFIQKRLFRPAFIRQLKKSGAKIVFDFDDAIMISQRSHWSHLTSRRTRLRFQTICAQADLILAGNHYLSTQIMPGHATVKVLPTVVDASRYSEPTQNKIHDGILLGWIGQPVNYCYLNELAPVLSKLSHIYPNIKLLVISKGEFKMDGVCVETVEWHEDSELHHLARIDIGLMPIPDNEWARGKCALKAIQYMATGLPTVCSDIGANRDVVRNEIDGFLVKNESEWFLALERLIQDLELRIKMGTNARERAMQHYSLHEAEKRMAGWLEKLITNCNEG